MIPSMLTGLKKSAVFCWKTLVIKRALC